MITAPFLTPLPPGEGSGVRKTCFPVAPAIVPQPRGVSHSKPSPRSRFLDTLSEDTSPSPQSPSPEGRGATDKQPCFLISWAFNRAHALNAYARRERVVYSSRCRFMPMTTIDVSRNRNSGLGFDWETTCGRGTMAGATEEQVFLTPDPSPGRERGDKTHCNHRSNPPLSLRERGHGVRVIFPSVALGIAFSPSVETDPWRDGLPRFLDTSYDLYLCPESRPVIWCVLLSRCDHGAAVEIDRGLCE
jgi:hypothetical protein